MPQVHGPSGQGLRIGWQRCDNYQTADEQIVFGKATAAAGPTSQRMRTNKHGRSRAVCDPLGDRELGTAHIGDQAIAVHDRCASGRVFRYLLHWRTAYHQVGISRASRKILFDVIHSADLQRGQWRITWSTNADDLLRELSMPQGQPDGTTEQAHSDDDGFAILRTCRCRGTQLRAYFNLRVKKSSNA